jgi:hypothetical protein
MAGRCVAEWHEVPGGAFQGGLGLLKGTSVAEVRDRTKSVHFWMRVFPAEGSLLLHQLPAFYAPDSRHATVETLHAAIFNASIS